MPILLLDMLYLNTLIYVVYQRSQLKNNDFQVEKTMFGHALGIRCGETNISSTNQMQFAGMKHYAIAAY